MGAELRGIRIRLEALEAEVIALTQQVDEVRLTTQPLADLQATQGTMHQHLLLLASALEEEINEGQNFRAMWQRPLGEIAGSYSGALKLLTQVEQTQQYLSTEIRNIRKRLKKWEDTLWPAPWQTPWSPGVSSGQIKKNEVRKEVFLSRPFTKPGKSWILTVLTEIPIVVPDHLGPLGGLAYSAQVRSPPQPCQARL